MADIPPTRASLLLRLRDPRDKSAWAEFVDLYGPLVYGYVRKQGLQDADAADICQDVLSAVAGAVGRLEYDPRRGAFRNWLFTVVRRKLGRWRATQSNQVHGSGDSAVQQLLEQCPVPQDETEWQREWEQRLLTWACEQIRGEVSDAAWQAFCRTAIGGQRGKQVADELGLTVVAVYHARSRILARLKEFIRSAQES